jgi:TctA family transporter
MIEVFFTLIAAIFSGILVGLLPGLPIWLGIFIVFPFLDSLSSLQIMIYWLGIAIGSQFFGSVSTLLLRIPGENSSLIYLKDTFSLSLQERLDLIRQTAWGSAFATLFAVLIVSILYFIGTDDSIIKWTNSSVKFSVYVLLIMMLILSADKKVWAIFLLIVGILLAEKTNQALPIWILQIDHLISHLTIFSATLALILIPEMIYYKNSFSSSEIKNLSYSKEHIKWGKIIPGSIIGCFSGLIPGMTATIGSISAYKFTNGTVKDKIISAESANNSAIITALLPFLIIGIPTTIDSIMVGNALNLKLLEIPSVFRDQVLFGISLGWVAIFIGLLFSLVFFYLSQRFLPLYIKFLDLMHGKLFLVYVAVTMFLIYFDVTTNTVNISAYLVMMVSLSIIGIWLKKTDINPLPLLLGLLLGDSILWTIYHMIAIYL